MLPPTEGTGAGDKTSCHPIMMWKSPAYATTILSFLSKLHHNFALCCIILQKTGGSSD
jgi:hypothetical protein